MKIRTSNRRSNQHFRILPVIIAMAAAGLAQPVLAVDRTWGGGSGGDWGVATNWSPTGVPGGSDTVILNGGYPNLSFDTTIASMDFRTGELRGIGTLSITGPSTWRDGRFGGEGTAQFLGDLSITGSPDKEISQRVVSVTNTTWGSNTAPNSNVILLDDGATIGNNSTWSDTNAFDSSIARQYSFRPGGSFHNLGIYNKQGSAVTTIGSGVSYQNTGTTNVDAGTMRIENPFTNSGVIAVDAGATFQVSGDDDTTFSNAATGTIQGGGTVITPMPGLTNSGAINPGDAVGHLTIDGDLHQAESGELNFGLASSSNFDQLTITDDVTWGGELVISNSGYTPVVGDTFVVATFDERLTDSAFSSVTTDGFGPGVVFAARYDNPQNLTLEVTAVPEPESWAMLLAGLGLMGALTRRRQA